MKLRTIISLSLTCVFVASHAAAQKNLGGSAIDELCNPKVLQLLAVPATAISTVANLAGDTVSQANKLVHDTMEAPDRAKDELKREFTQCALTQPGLNSVLSTAELITSMTALIGNGVGTVALATEASKECADQAVQKMKDKVSESKAQMIEQFGQCLGNIPGLPSIISNVVGLVKLLQQLQGLVEAASGVVKNGTRNAALSCVGGIPGANEVVGILGQCTGIASGLSSVWKVYEGVAGAAGTPKQLAADIASCAQTGVGTVVTSALGPMAGSITGITGGVGNLAGGLVSGAGDLMKLPSGRALKDLKNACALLRRNGSFKGRARL